ncbi:hypothetical protein [Endobacterium cereale]|uniref:hypothetical protein n=1 Tax=Endobacterium cereale TaxID=2663029 RepID=UPI002B460766|nr:hypothetical protein [Endobacterium cereale]MEB2846818.1 hypothetical protein [Endobacterium cereale]
MKPVFLVLASAFSVAAGSAFAMGGYVPVTMAVHPKEPFAEIYLAEGIGSENARIESNFTEQTKQQWCDSWRPGDGDCLKSFDGSDEKAFKASANCKAGILIDPDGREVEFAGHFRGDKLFNANFQFREKSTGSVVGQDNAAGGQVLAGLWADLCPLGAPYDILPLSAKIDTNAPVESLRQMADNPMAASIGHNGSVMKIDPDLGIITYFQPKNKSIERDTVLFRGQGILSGNVSGIAYTFKKGCEPAPYYVSGHEDDRGRLVLIGKVPVREGCKVIGYTENSANAKLVFEYYD